MRAAAMSVWIFINLLCFGMCGYLYLIWSQYWMSLEKHRFTKVSVSQDTSATDYHEPIDSYSVFNSTRADAAQKRRRSAVGAFWNTDKLAQSLKPIIVRPSTNIVRRTHGSPRFPNIHKPVLEFDSEKFVCYDYSSIECETRTTEFKKLLIKEFHRVLMGESRVFRSGLDSQNHYDVKYISNDKVDYSGPEILCALSQVKMETVTVKDEPFASLGFRIQDAPLQEGREFNTCAVVSSAGALLGSRLGEFIDSHDMVLRFNNAPTLNYTDDVGSKTTFRILNSQVISLPEYNFLTDSLYENISILIWDPANYSSTLDMWYQHPDFPLFPVYKRLLETRKRADVHLLKPQVLWDLWAVLQDTSPYRLRRNPPSSGFLGMWFALHRCARVRMFEYVPSARATRRCHYHGTADDVGCTLGAWHPLAQEKAIAERIRDNSDFEVFQRGFVDIPGFRTINCA